jgi:hypothetical protein
MFYADAVECYCDQLCVTKSAIKGKMETRSAGVEKNNATRVSRPRLGFRFQFRFPSADFAILIVEYTKETAAA